MAWFTNGKIMLSLSTATQFVMYRNPGLHACTIPVVLYRLGYMFWSDVSHDIIAAARMNGTGLTILVNSSINVPGNSSLFRTYAKTTLLQQYFIIRLNTCKSLFMRLSC